MIAVVAGILAEKRSTEKVALVRINRSRLTCFHAGPWTDGAAGHCSPHDGRRCLHRHQGCAAVRDCRSRRNHRTNSRRGNCSDLRGSGDYSASCGGTTKHGISTANRFRPLKREQLPAEDSIDGATWILETIDGQPPVAGTHLTLTISGPQFGGFDGCNSFGGRHQSGTPVVEPDGSISATPFAITAAGCPTDAVLDQANRYLEAMTQEARARVVDDHLHIVDDSGEVALVFARQTP